VKHLTGRIPEKLRAWSLLCASIAALALLSGCMTTRMYIDPTLPVVSRVDVHSPQQLRPAQLLFEFRTKGSANSAATSEIRPRVATIAAESGLFSSVSRIATGNDAGVLKIIIDNVPITQNATAKGIGIGLTLGLAGGTVSDGYVCNAAYTRDGKTTEVTVEHALHTTIGNRSGPQGSPAMDPRNAIQQVMDQITWNLLKELNDQHAFD
jgi:hypothetical protein